MTDSEKELRRLAEYVRQNPGVAVKLAIACGAREVIALLDRIEALEKQVIEAERKGAEEMRKKESDLCWLKLVRESAEGMRTRAASLARDRGALDLERRILGLTP